MKLRKLLLAVFALITGLLTFKTYAQLTPHTAETIGRMITAVVVPPAAVKNIRLTWNFPIFRQTPDLIFKVYHSTNLAASLRFWVLLTNIPGTLRMVDLPAVNTQDFFVLTASNYLGESGFSRD